MPGPSAATRLYWLGKYGSLEGLSRRGLRLRRVLLPSIPPRFTDSILDGTKTIELRRTRPRVAPGDPVLIYACSPVKAIVGSFVVEELIQAYPGATPS